MNTPEYPNDPLFEVERKIARRADELTRRLGVDPARALEHWRRAEREVWNDFPSRARPQPQSTAEATG